MRGLIAFIVIFGNIWVAYSTPVAKCDNMAPPIFVDVIGCKQEPCDFVTGTNLIMKIIFDSPLEALNLKPRVIASTLGLEVDYPLPQSDACADIIRGGCPIEKGQRSTYQLTMPISSAYPKIAIDIKFSLYTKLEDGQELDLTCFKIKGKVV